MNNPLNRLSKVFYQNSYSSDPLFTVQDVCGPVYTWPGFVKKLVVSKTLSYGERLKLCAFFWVNGWRNSDSWLQLIISLKGPAFVRYGKELKGLYDYFNMETTQKKYFSYCTRHKRYEYLDGSVRHVQQ